MYETCRIKYKNCECCLEYINLKDDLMEYKCFMLNKNYQKRFLRDQSTSLLNHNINRFILLL